MSSTFALDLKRFAEKAEKNAHDMVGTVVSDIAVRIDMRSPVGDPVGPPPWKNPPPPGYVGGHFRANWQIGINTIPSGEVAGVDTSPKNGKTGGATTAKIQAAIPEQAAGKVYYIVNNLPYAQALEDGHSPQAKPGQMVGLTVTEFQAMVADALARERT